MNPLRAVTKPNTPDTAGDSTRTVARPNPDQELPAAGRSDQAESPAVLTSANTPNVSEALADGIRRSRAPYPLGGGISMRELINEGRR